MLLVFFKKIKEGWRAPLVRLIKKKIIYYFVLTKFSWLSQKLRFASQPALPSPRVYYIMITLLYNKRRAPATRSVEGSKREGGLLGGGRVIEKVDGPFGAGPFFVPSLSLTYTCIWRWESNFVREETFHPNIIYIYNIVGISFTPPFYSLTHT